MASVKVQTHFYRRQSTKKAKKMETSTQIKLLAYAKEAIEMQLESLLSSVINAAEEVALPPPESAENFQNEAG